MDGGGELVRDFGISFQRTANDVRDGVDGDNCVSIQVAKVRATRSLDFKRFSRQAETLFKVSDLVILLQKSFAHGDDFFVRTRPDSQ